MVHLQRRQLITKPTVTDVPKSSAQSQQRQMGLKPSCRLHLGLFPQGLTHHWPAVLDLGQRYHWPAILCAQRPPSLLIRVEKI